MKHVLENATPLPTVHQEAHPLALTNSRFIQAKKNSIIKKTHFFAPGTDVHHFNTLFIHPLSGNIQ
jgi:hypothetical protein